jgi:hypothetical protein
MIVESGDDTSRVTYKFQLKNKLPPDLASVEVEGFLLGKTKYVM